MTSIYLIRHGQASFDAAEYDELSALGIKQAKRLGEGLQQRLASVDKVIHGGMRRHVQTMQYCMSEFVQLKFDQLADDNWREYDHQQILLRHNPHFASAEQMKNYLAEFDHPALVFQQEFEMAINRWISGEHDADYSESWPQFVRRIKQALANTLVAAKGKKRVLVFTSGGPIALVSQQLLGIEAKNMLRLNWTLNNCGVTKLFVSRNGLVLSSLNEHSLFEGEYQHLISYK
ncbi:histidine phosphatase family protein [Neptunicella sp. SCSIO 80796]|uniref:histidine phosphatase family protein n=1 Tax=Neptunicella plasticusilytica TaxID=3117012 RepID=UPI003A4E231D